MTSDRVRATGAKNIIWVFHVQNYSYPSDDGREQGVVARRASWDHPWLSQSFPSIYGIIGELSTPGAILPGRQSTNRRRIRKR